MSVAEQTTSNTMNQQDTYSKINVKQPDLDNSHGCAADDAECIRFSTPPKIEHFRSPEQYPVSWLLLMAGSFALFALLTIKRRA